MIFREQLSRNAQFFKQDGQANIERAYVVVVGVGGVGSHAAHMLARAGVARLRLIDFDQVTLSSLNRHVSAVPGGPEDRRTGSRLFPPQRSFHSSMFISFNVLRRRGAGAAWFRCVFPSLPPPFPRALGPSRDSDSCLSRVCLLPFFSSPPASSFSPSSSSGL